MRLLIVQTGFLGDLILATPVFGLVRSQFPRAELTCLCRPDGEGLIRNDPRLNQIITFDKRREDRGWSGLRRVSKELKGMGFDRAYALHRSWRSALLLKLAGIPERWGFADAPLSGLYTKRRVRSKGSNALERLAGLVSDHGSPKVVKPELFLGDNINYSSEVQAVLESGTAYIVIAPGSAWRTKQWLPEGFRAAVKLLLARDLDIVVVGGKEDQLVGAELARDLPVRNLVGRTDLQELMALVARSTLVLGNDSMILHVASAFERPVVGIYCATVPKQGFAPTHADVRLVERSDLSCRPCSRHGGDWCPIGTFECSRGITARSVVDSVGELLR